MKNKRLFILVFVLFISLFSINVYAQDVCSKNGYTVITINGIFTDENGAILNKNALGFKLSHPYKNEPIKVDYIYNPTHLAGAGDIFDVIRQGLFDQKSDYDLVEMLNDASDKVGTQKLLIVGHSQGNFYANSFYNKVVDKEGGVPSSSIGVYGVATPASYVAGNGKYLTSDTDTVIAAVVSRLKNIMTPNTHIELQKVDGDGHSFSDVYLKYRSSTIVSDIKSSFDKLKTNTVQDEGSRCISPQKITALHKVTGALLATADFSVNTGVKSATFGYNLVSKTTKSLVNTFTNLAKRSLALVGFADTQSDNLSTTEQVLNDTPAVEEPAITTIESQSTQTTETINTQTTDIDIPGSTLDTNPVTDIIPAPPDILNNSEHNNGEGKIETTPLEPITLDTVSPIITLKGENVITINLNTEYLDEGATASDNIDTTIDVITTGTVDTSTIGAYVLTYNATDKAGNIASPVIRTINVVEAPVVLDETPPVISIIGGNFQAIKLNSEYIESGATALDDKDGVIPVVTTGTVDTSALGDNIITYTATDLSGNTSIVTRTVRVSTYVYLPKYTFGKDNGDGLDWQVWAFNGSNVYDWSDTYVNKYLRQQFKIQNYYGFWCSDCLEMGIFKHDPKKGFEYSDLVLQRLESNVQNYGNNKTYDVVIQWDSTGYTYTVFDSLGHYENGHINVLNMNNDLWVGWDGSQTGFKKFPSGDWIGISGWIPGNRNGGINMMMAPYPVYDELAENTVPLPIPNPPAPVLSSEKLITSFNFKSLTPEVVGVVDNTSHTISLTVPYGTDIKTLIPTITISDKATVLPANLMAQDFTSPVTYVVKAEDNSELSYLVTVNILPNPDVVPIPDPVDNSLPVITSYTLNGNQSNVTLNPLADNVTIVLNANKNVNWKSIKIENESDPTLDKIFQSGEGCVDGTKICTKTWNGGFPGDRLLLNGNYKIKVHIEDSLMNEYYEYLDSIITVIGQAI